MSRAELSIDELTVKYPKVPRFIVLKIDAQRRGIKLTKSALDAVQVPLYRYGSHNGISTERDTELAYPGPMLLRDGTSVLVSAAVASQYEDPYTVDHVDGRFYISDHGNQIDEVDFTPRPDFYGKQTSRGIPMEAIASARPQRLDIQPYRYCHFWDTKDQCKFCGFFTDLKEQRQAAGDQYVKLLDPQDIYETVREALRESGRISQINLTAGADYSGDTPFENEVNRYVEVLQAIGKNFKTRRFSSQLIAPAYTKKQVERIYAETGLISYCPDIEVWDEKLFKWICTGKDKVVGRTEWIKRTIDAVEIFGKGNVYTNFVAGVETAQPHGFENIDDALRSCLEGCEFFAKHGVVYLSLVWRPWKSSVFSGQKQPPLEYYVRLVKELRDIRRAYGLSSDNDDYKHCGNHADSDLERVD